MAGPSEQTRAGHRRERHRDLELGIVVAARALERFCPAMIEDVFAARVDLHVAGCGPHKLARGVLGEEVSGLPAGSSTHRTRRLKRGQKFV